MNIRFLWDTLGSDNATFTATGEKAGWPVANLQHPQTAKAYKSVSGQETITVLCDKEEMVTAVAVIGHDLGAASVVTVRGYDSNNELVGSEEFEVLLPVYTAGELLPCSSTAGGYPTDDDLAVLPRTTAVFFLKKPMCVSKYDVKIDNGETPFYIGRMILADYFSPARNLGLNWNGCPQDESNVQTSIGGQSYANQKKRRYQYSGRLSFLTKTEAYGPVLKMLYYCGVSRPLVACLAPGDDFLRQYTSVYCTFQTTPKLTCVRGGDYPYSMNFVVREML